MTLKTLRPKRVLPYDNKRELSSRLREENSRLKTDVARLRIEKAHLRTKNVQVPECSRTKSIQVLGLNRGRINEKI